jgi:hypothetical protein
MEIRLTDTWPRRCERHRRSKLASDVVAALGTSDALKPRFPALALLAARVSLGIGLAAP